MERPRGGWLPPPLPLTELGLYITEGGKKKWILGRGGRETGWRASLLGQTAELKNGYKAGSPKPSYNQTAPEQGPSANPCPPAPLPAFGVLWEGMVEAAWRGLL